MPSATNPRFFDWPTRWVKFMKDSIDLDASRDLSLDWSEQGITCMSWSMDGVEAITGENPYDPYRGQFNTVLGAAKTIRKAGFETLDQLIGSIFPETPIGMAQQGDVVLVRNLCSLPEEASSVMPNGVALADPPFYYGVSEVGLVKGDMYSGAVVRAFAVGRGV